jgi:fucose permease
MRADHTRRVLLLSSASFAVLGVCLTLPGALLPLLIDQFGITLVETGSMLALQPGAYLLAVLAAGRLMQQLGMRTVLSAGLLLAGTGLAIFGLVSSGSAAGATLFVNGVGLGLIEVANNTLLIAVGGERRSNLLNFAHLFFGVGSFVAPALATHAVAAGVSWRWVFAVGGGVTAAVGLAWGALLSDAVTVEQPSVGDSRKLHTRLVMLLGMLLGVYVGAETGIGAWLTKYLVSVREVALTSAGDTLALYWLGLTAGRLVLSGASHRVREDRLLLGLTMFAGLALTSALLAPTAWSAAVGFTATGVGLSGIFPAVIALGGRTHPRDTARVTGLLVAGAGLGGIVIPWTMSAIAERAGLVTGMAFYLGMIAVMVALTVGVMGSLRTNGAE